MKLASAVVLAAALVSAAFLIGGRYATLPIGGQVWIIDRLSGESRVCDRDLASLGVSSCKTLR